MRDGAAPPLDPGSLIRSRQYRVLLVFAAVIGVLVSLASWGFLELVYYIQHGVYKDLPSDLGYSSVPWWWPLPWLALAGMLTAFAILRLPGRGGHVPADGLKTGGAPTQPIELPGILLAALATLGLGLVLGPEAPLIAVGMGLGAWAIRLARKDAPDQVVALMAAAGGLRRHLLAVRLPRRRRRDHHRGHRPRRGDAAGNPASRPARRRNRLARVHRHGIADRPQHERLRLELRWRYPHSPNPTGATSSGRSHWPSQRPP